MTVATVLSPIHKARGRKSPLSPELCLPWPALSALSALPALSAKPALLIESESATVQCIMVCRKLVLFFKAIFTLLGSSTVLCCSAYLH